MLYFHKTFNPKCAKRSVNIFEIYRNCRTVARQVLLVPPRRRAEVGRKGEPVHASEVPGKNEQLHQKGLCRGRRVSGNLLHLCL